MNRTHLLKAARKRKYLVLLVSLLALAVLHPTVQKPYAGSGTLSFLLCVLLGAVLFAVSQRRRTFWVAVILGIPALSAIWGDYFAGSFSPPIRQFLVYAHFVALLVFLVYAAILILWDVLRIETVSADQLCGAMSVYLLLGVIWAMLYSMIAYSQPGAFAFAVTDLLTEVQHGSDPRAFSSFVYYSFVTLTTLGYGDITPVTSVARTFSWLEAVLGQLYLAVLIARLVGLHIAHAVRK